MHTLLLLSWKKEEIQRFTKKQSTKEVRLPIKLPPQFVGSKEPSIAPLILHIDQDVEWESQWIWNNTFKHCKDDPLQIKIYYFKLQNWGRHFTFGVITRNWSISKNYEYSLIHNDKTQWHIAIGVEVAHK